MGLFDWLRHMVRGSGGQRMDRTRFEEMVARLRAEEEKAWWKDMTSLVSTTDQQLVVIKPVADVSPDILRMLAPNGFCGCLG